MLLLGIDLGTSSIKVSVLDAATQQCLCSVQYPDAETPIISLQNGWAEQSPNQWWEHVQQAILKANASGNYNPQEIVSIGIAYQMHGLVCLDAEGQVLRNSIIWCDSRAVPYGEKAFEAIGPQKALASLLNSPGNFTAAKLAWVKENEPEIFEKIHKVMLPGDFIAYRLTGELTTTPSALSEGVFWDFEKGAVSSDVMNAFGFNHSLIPEIRDVFTIHGQLTASMAAHLGLKEGVPVAYKSGDQPNNAFSLNVLQPGEVAATAGTSGVVYGVTDKVNYDPLSRVNGFAHVNHTSNSNRIGVLLCINGTGILNSWLKNNFFAGSSYPQMNEEAASISAGSDGLRLYPFGNGAERVLQNKEPGAQLKGLHFNRHQRAHVARAAQEGIVFSLQYGMETMRAMGMELTTVRAGLANMFLSPVFGSAFATVTGCALQLYNTDGAAGAARAAGLGAGIYKSESECFQGMQLLKEVNPDAASASIYKDAYEDWKAGLEF